MARPGAAAPPPDAKARMAAADSAPGGASSKGLRTPVRTASAVSVGDVAPPAALPGACGARAPPARVGQAKLGRNARAPSGLGVRCRLRAGLVRWRGPRLVPVGCPSPQPKTRTS
jgi:hypothetical protein